MSLTPTSVNKGSGTLWVLFFPAPQLPMVVLHHLLGLEQDSHCSFPQSNKMEVNHVSGRQRKEKRRLRQWRVARAASQVRTEFSPRRKVWIRQVDAPSSCFLLPDFFSDFIWVLYNHISRRAPGKTHLCSKSWCLFSRSQRVWNTSNLCKSERVVCWSSFKK